MSTDPVIQSLENGQAELPGGSQKQNGNGKTDVKKDKSCDVDGIKDDSTNLKVDGLAVTMDGREIEVTRLPGTVDEQDADAQDLDSRRQTQLRKQNRFTKASVLIPPENFGIVEDGLYRSVSVGPSIILATVQGLTSRYTAAYPLPNPMHCLHSETNRVNLQNSTSRSSND
jgi:hypothetical protein